MSLPLNRRLVPRFHAGFTPYCNWCQTCQGTIIHWVVFLQSLRRAVYLDKPHIVYTFIYLFIALLIFIVVCSVSLLFTLYDTRRSRVHDVNHSGIAYHRPLFFKFLMRKLHFYVVVVC